MKLLKIILTILVIVISGLVLLVGIAIAASSHSISMSDRNYAVLRGVGAVIFGIILIILIWLPWKKIYNRY